MTLLIMGELDYGTLISHQIHLLILKVKVYFLVKPFNVGDWERSHRERNRSHVISVDIHVIFMKFILLLFFRGLVHYLLMIMCDTLVGLASEVLAHEGNLENLTFVIID